ncbi:MAG: MBL fold metallo-hydrolase [Acidimicrobiia bacterium]
MGAYAFPTRRMLLRDMGKAGLAVVILGTAACSSESTDNATPTPETTGGPTSTGSTPTSAAGSTALPGTSPAGGYDWHRANLGFVSAYILYRGGEATLVDTGASNSEGAIEAALAEIDLGWDSVGSVVITHKHPDHQGSLQPVLAATDAPWYAGAGDIPAITASSQGTPVGDGDRVDELDIIETPGHTPGHISVLDSTAGILVAGDAINGGNSGVAGPNPDFSEDMDLANASVAKLAGFDYEVVLFGHGEPVLAEGSAQVGDLAQTGG